MTYTVAALYQFVALPDFEALRAPLKALCLEHDLIGTLLLAPEGINGTIAGTDAGIAAVIQALTEGPLFGERLDNLELKYSTATTVPFQRMKVRLKREIVTLKQPVADPREVVGTYVAPEDWNALISDPGVIVVDTRNHYEITYGTFAGAVDPLTDSFSDFPDYVTANLSPDTHPRVAMFCTGGIRCEKASAYMLKQGFPEVYHLKGGILNYLEKIPPEQSLWQGECFVFDGREALGHGLSEKARSDTDLE